MMHLRNLPCRNRQQRPREEGEEGEEGEEDDKKGEQQSKMHWAFRMAYVFHAPFSPILSPHFVIVT